MKLIKKRRVWISWYIVCAFMLSSFGFLLHTTQEKVYAAPPDYTDFLDLYPNQVVLGTEVSLTIYLDNSYENFILDESNVLITLDGGSYVNFPFVKTEYDDYSRFDTLIWNGSSYDVIHTYDLNGEYNYFYMSGTYTIGNWAYGMTMKNTGSTDVPFFFVRDFSANNPTDTSPVIDGWEGVYFTNVDQPVTLSSLQSLLYAYDAEDGDVTNRIVLINDSYTANKDVVGTYSVQFECSDLSDNTASLTIYVQVVDGTAPIIQGESTFTSTISSPVTVESLISNFSVVDNYDTISSSQIRVKTDGFTANRFVKGSYSVLYEVNDTAGNIGTKNITIQVLDDIAPQMSGTNTYTKGQHAILQLDTILAGLSASDNSDGDVTSSIQLVEDNYSIHADSVGTWTLKYRAMDTSGNPSSLFIVSITVTDSMPPVFYVSEQIMHVDSSLSLTHQQIVDILVNTNQIDVSQTYSTLVLQDDYQGTQEAGTYAIQLQVDYEDGQVQIIQLTMKVVDQTPPEKPIAKWYKSWGGWTSKWFGVRFIYDGAVGIFQWMKIQVLSLVHWFKSNI